MGYSNGKVYNDYLEYAVANGGSYNGRFTIGTTGGDPSISTDDNQMLLYNHPEPQTSFSTIRVDGNDYVYNPDIQSPTVDESQLSNTSESSFTNVSVKQVLRIVKNSSTNREDIVEVKYIVKNNDSNQHDVGLRIMLDTKLGSNDNAPFRVPGIGSVTKELELTGNSIPQYWQAFDDLNSPSVVAHGTLLKSQYLRPDKVQFVKWSGINNTLWDYVPNTSQDIGDSAVGVYWNPRTLAPNGSAEFVTYYGLSDLTQVSNGTFGLNLTGDSNIDLTADGYNPNPFTVTAYVRNNGATSISNTKVKITLPAGLVLSSGQQQEISLGTLTAGLEKQISWKVEVVPGTASGTLNYQVTVTGDNAASVTANRVVDIASLPSMQGSGTVADPYIISTSNQLGAIRYNLSAHYRLANNVNFAGEEWTPIGSNSNPFTGSFDGNGYTISNLVINQPNSDYIGFFGYTSNATVRNLNISNVSIVGRNYVGSIIGYAAGGSGSMEGCSVSGTGTVNGVGYIGGLAGSFYGSISGCYSTLNVGSTGNYVGGLVGYLSYNDSNTPGITRSYSTGSVLSTASRVGGLVGYCAGNITECYATGNVRGTSYIGGLVGQANLAFSYNSITYACTISNSFSIGSVTGTDASAYAGGLLGYVSGGTVKNCYCTGSIVTSSEGGYTGGIIGYISSVTMIGCYYDSFASRYVPQDSYDVGRLTSGMISQATFIGRNFSSIWTIEQGASYPYLRAVPKPAKVSLNLPPEDMAGGDGTPEDPYVIINAAQISNIKFDIQSCYTLHSDVNLENIEWIPIGKDGAAFTGSFDGNGFTISNLFLNQPTSDNVGFFGYTNNATLKNINISNINVTGKNNVGALTGYEAGGSGSVDNCSVSGTGIINGTGYVGGLVGRLYGSISSCYSTINVNSTGSYTGGLAGYCTNSNNLTPSITRSYATGDVTSTSSNVGGLVGRCVGNITESYATGNVKGTSYVGGLVGYANLAFSYNSSTYVCTIKDSFSLGSVTGTDSNPYVGGLLGYVSGGVLKNCYCAGIITPNGTNTGGIIGYVGSVTMIGCYYDSMASGYIPQDSYDVGRLTSGMTNQSTFSGWDFSSVWTIEQSISYPYLRNITKPQMSNIPVNEVAGGDGTSANPYIIENTAQLNSMKYDLQSCYKLNSDIDLANTEWTVVGKNGAPFTGSFNGNGHTISNIYISQPTLDYIGLFGYTNNATIKDLKINNVSISGKSYVGSLIGYAAGSSGNIQGCSIGGTGTINGTGYVGGLTGYFNGTIDKCNATINISCGTGGYAGGLAGYCTVVSGTSSRPSVSKSYATGNVAGTGSYNGGLIGNCTGNVSECYAMGNVAGVNYVGGLVGYARLSFSSGSTSYACQINDCFAGGRVTGTNSSSGYAGGLIGYLNAGTLKNSYSVGRVTGAGSSVGGLHGYITSATVTNCYFDSNTTGLTIPVAQARSTTQMMQQSNYVNWDFLNIWNINEGGSYPSLRNI